MSRPITSAADLERALAAAGLEAPVRWDEVTGSTNATAVALAASGAPEWTLVGAGHQTAGRGRLGRTWHDPAGRALLCSLVLRPSLEPGRAGLLSLLAGAAIAEAAREAAGVPATCKWPNDLLIGERKAGGILAESDVVEDSLRSVVLGLGVNLAAPEGVPTGAGLGDDVDPVALLGSFLSAFRDGYRPQDEGFPGKVVERWTAVASTLGRRVAATTIDGGAIEGEAVGVDERGGLIVRRRDGTATVVGFGEVEHLS